MIAGIGSPADIYAQFMDEQKHRHQSGQPSTLDQVQDDDSVVLDGSAGLAALSRMKLRDADDDDDDDDPSDANGNVIDGDEENAARSIDLSRTPERSSLKKKKNKAPRDARVRFNEEPQVKEFCKSDSAGPAVSLGHSLVLLPLYCKLPNVYDVLMFANFARLASRKC